jgi:hypothetical protein
MRNEEDFSATLPFPLRDFIFDLYYSVRVEKNLENVQRLYELKLKEITDTYFAQSTWPDVKSISHEVKNDELFLALYK